MGAPLGGGSKGRGRDRFSRHPFTEINVTPLVDVMLVLLVIFMVTAPMMTAGVQVELPKTNAPALAGQDEPVTIFITSNGKISLQKNEIEIRDLQKKLVAIAGEKRDTRIFIKGDRTVDYGRVMQAVSEVSAAGFTKVSFITEPGPGAK